MASARTILALTMLAVVVILAGALAVWSPEPTPRPIAVPSNKLGVHLLLDDGRHHWPVDVWPEHLRYARAAVGDWGFVTQVIRSDDLDPARWNDFMRLCRALHLTPILRLATTFDRERRFWATPAVDADGSYRTLAARYAAFAAALDWPTAEHFLIVGNEPNHGDEWGGSPDPAAYARLLIDVAAALHAADADARVLNAALDPFTPNTGGAPFVNGMIYLDEAAFMDGMNAAEPNVFRSIDGWNSHAYPLGPMTRPPWEQTYQIDRLDGGGMPTAPPGIVNRGVNGYEWEQWKLSTFGIGPLPVFITETGWRHSDSDDPASTDGSADLPDATIAGTYLALSLFGNNGNYPQYPKSNALIPSHRGLAALDYGQQTDAGPLSLPSPSGRGVKDKSLDEHDGSWIPWLDDARLYAVTPFALDGLPSEWGHTNWLRLDASGAVVGTYPLYDVMRGAATGQSADRPGEPSPVPGG